MSTPRPSASPRVAAFDSLLQVALALTMTALAAPPLRQWVVAWQGPFTPEAPLPTLAWLALPAVGLPLATARAVAFGLGRPGPRFASVIQVGLLAAALIGRAAMEPSGEVGWVSLHGAPPVVRAVEAMGRVGEALRQARRAQAPWPGVEALTETLQVEGRPLGAGWFFRGLETRPLKVVLHPDARGAFEQLGADGQPGVLHVALGPPPDRHFWVTATTALFEEGRWQVAFVPAPPPAGIRIETSDTRF